MENSDTLIELIKQAVSSINMLSSTDLSEIDELQSILEQISQRTSRKLKAVHIRLGLCRKRFRPFKRFDCADQIFYFLQVLSTLKYLGFGYKGVTWFLGFLFQGERFFRPMISIVVNSSNRWKRKGKKSQQRKGGLIQASSFT